MMHRMDTRMGSMAAISAVCGSLLAGTATADVFTIWERGPLGSGITGVYIDDPVNNRQLSGTPNLRLGRSGFGSSTYRGTSYGYQTIAVEGERRYRISLTGIRNDFGGVHAGVWYASAHVNGMRIGKTDDRNSDEWQIERDTFTTPADATELEFRFNSFLNFSSSSVTRWHEMRDARIELILEAPELDLSETELFITVHDPTASMVEVSLTPLLLNAFEDRPNAASIDWGDGTIVPVLDYGASLTHAYGVSGRGTYTFDITFAGSNLAGSDLVNASVTINVVPSPGAIVVVSAGVLYSAGRHRRWTKRTA